MRYIVLLFFALAVIAAGSISRAEGRSSSELRAFKREHPCPSTGATRGSCRGYVVDHVVPICAGGEDARRNMQWQTRAEATAKDAEEHRLCRKLRKESAASVAASSQLASTGADVRHFSA